MPFSLEKGSLLTEKGLLYWFEDGKVQNAKAYPKRVIHAGNLAYRDDKRVWAEREGLN